MVFIPIENIEIIGIMGNIGSGKNYIAEQILLPELNRYNTTETMFIAFADHFKVHAICFENLDYDKVFIKKDINTRNNLQQLGTELGRDKFGEDIWIKVVYNWIKVHSSRNIKRFIITDVRFENEINFIKNIGGIIIKIYAPDRNKEKLLQEAENDLSIIENISNHSSELFIEKYIHYDYIVDNRKTKDVSAQIRKVVYHLYEDE